MPQDGRLYSPRQVFWAAFLAGPVALTWLLASNFRGLGREDQARRYLLAGLAGCMLLLVVLTFLPGPASIGAFVGLGFAGRHLVRAHHFQGEKKPPEGTPLQGNGRTFAVAVACFFAWLAGVIVFVLVLDAAGIPVPD